VSVVVVLAAVAHDVRFSPAVAWLLASLNLAVIVVALGMFVSTRGRTSREPRADHEAPAPVSTPAPRAPTPSPPRTGPSPSGDDEPVTVVPRTANPDTPSASAPPGEDELVARLDDPDPLRRVEAVAVLRGRGDSEHLLLRALDDEYPVVRREVVRVLRAAGGSVATETLIKVAGHDPSAEVREEAVAALGSLLRDRGEAGETREG
jgi:hypothetical protein